MTPELLDQCIDKNVGLKFQRKIVIEKHASKVSKNLTDISTLRYLRSVTEAYNENLLVEQSMMLTEALWQMKRKLVFIYSSIFFL